MICNGNSNDCNERDDEIINKGCCVLIAGPIKNKGSLRAFDLFLFLPLGASHVENHISLDFLQIFFWRYLKQNIDLSSYILKAYRTQETLILYSKQMYNSTLHD